MMDVMVIEVMGVIFWWWQVMVVVTLEVIGLAGLPVECTSRGSPPRSPVPHVGYALAGSRVQWGLLDSLFLLTSTEHSLLGNEMQIDRKDNEPACGQWGSF